MDQQEVSKTSDLHGVDTSQKKKTETPSFLPLGPYINKVIPSEYYEQPLDTSSWYTRAWGSLTRKLKRVVSRR